MRGPRPSCLACVRKHVAQAIVLLEESLLGYPEHRDLAAGHLAEASAESVADFPDLADELRLERLAMSESDAYTPLLMDILARCRELERIQES